MLWTERCWTGMRDGHISFCSWNVIVKRCTRCPLVVWTLNGKWLKQYRTHCKCRPTIDNLFQKIDRQIIYFWKNSFWSKASTMLFKIIQSNMISIISNNYAFTWGVGIITIEWIENSCTECLMISGTTSTHPPSVAPITSSSCTHSSHRWSVEDVRNSSKDSSTKGIGVNSAMSPCIRSVWHSVVSAHHTRSFQQRYNITTTWTTSSGRICGTLNVCQI